MKLEYFLLPALASAGLINHRQVGGSGKVAGVRSLTPEVNPKAKHTITRIGPYSLKGAGSAKDSGQQNFLARITDGFCRNCTVLKGHVGLESLDGKALGPKEGVYIHHILSFDTSKRQKSFLSGCSGISGALGALGSKFIGTGEDNNNVEVWYTTRDGAHQGGFHVGASDSFMMQIDLVSYKKEASKAYVTMEMEYLPGVIGPDTRETLLSVTGCGVGSIKISESGPTNTTSSKYTFTEDGQILGAKGHLHAGGDKMVMYINGKFACESKAQYGGEKGAAAIDNMSLCTMKPINVKKGDVLTMMAAYDLSKHPVRHESHGMGSGMPDIMGMWDLIFAGRG
jgi:hypothetical protein